MLTIVAPLEQELAGARQGWRPPARAGAPEPPVAWHVLGVGGARASARMRALLADRRQQSGPPGLVLLVGLAGSLDPTRRPGDLCLPARYLRADGGCLEPDPRAWRQATTAAAEAGLTVDRAASLTVPRVVNTPEEKASLGRQHGASIVDLEDYPVAEACAAAGVPFLVARAVLDPARQGLPSYLPGLAESRARAALSTLAKPWRGPELLRLARQLRLAQASLARFVSAYGDYRASLASRPATARG